MKTLAEIELEFEKQLEIPESKPEGAFLFCPVGFVGSGKTTVTQPISKIFNLVRLSSDELRKMLKENGYDYKFLKDIGFRVARKYVEEGYSLAFDMNCSNPLTKEFIDKLSQEFSLPAIWVHVNPPEEYIVNKLKSFKHTWLFKDAEQALGNYFHQKEKMSGDIEKIHFDYVLDTSQADFSDQINVLATIINTKISHDILSR